jgi:hypothetical protein
VTVEGAILEVPGVAAVSVERSGEAIVGVKIELEEGTEERKVASMIRTILEEHGYRSRIAPERVRVEPETPPMPPPMPKVEVVSDTAHDTDSDIPAPPDRKTAVAARSLRAVVVEEDRDGATVTIVDSEGNKCTKAAGSTQSGRRAAIVEAIATLLAESGPIPRVVEVVKRDDGVMLVVLEDQTGSPRAGASVLRAGEDFAFAVSVWTALAD